MPARESARLAAAPIDVVVAIVPETGDRAADHRMLATLAEPLVPQLHRPQRADAPAAPHHRGSLAITHRCGVCGSPDHGRPLLTAADGRVLAGVHVSLSRAAGRIALAATVAGPAGIDIESLDAVTRAGFDDVAFDATERAALHDFVDAHGSAAADRMRALAWSTKEAVLKAAGTGLRTDPRDLRLTLDPAVPVAHPALRDPGLALTLLPLDDLGAGLVGTVAVATRAPLRIRYSLGSDLP